MLHYGNGYYTGGDHYQITIKSLSTNKIFPFNFPIQYKLPNLSFDMFCFFKCSLPSFQCAFDTDICTKLH